ncbi:MAG: catalase [Actinobacteria bacterium]|nr:catalase [Actinomycetota bacterium]
MTTADGRSTRSATRWREVYLGGSPDAEAELFARFQVEIREVQDRNQARSRSTGPDRAFHAKSLGAVDNATFRVSPAVPTDLQVGLFQPGTTHRATVRFSNASGTRQRDSKKDLRGVAIRVHGPGGGQDFLMTNAPASHARNVIQFMAQARAKAESKTAVGMILRLIPMIGPREALRMAVALSRAVAHPVASISAETFWSRSAFAIGDEAVRFKLAPSEKTRRVLTPRRHEGLRDELTTRVGAGPVTFTLHAQRFVDEKRTPIEDGAQVWRERVSAPVVVAELTIPQQDLASDEAARVERQVEALAFNPWNTADGFRPLGNLNRARRPVYEAGAAHRSAGIEVPPRKGFAMARSPFSRILVGFASVIDRWKGWDRVPPLVGIGAIAGIRIRLRQKNLYHRGDVQNVPTYPPGEYERFRTVEGRLNDLEQPIMGAVQTRFGRNVPVEYTMQEEKQKLLDPNPRVISQKLLSRKEFIPAGVNVLTAAWIQFEIHDWVSHGDNAEGDPWQLDVPDDKWPQDRRPMTIPRTAPDPEPETKTGPSPTYISYESHWWDGSQIYGNDPVWMEKIRTDPRRADGKLKVRNGLVPEELGENLKLSGPAGNLWLGTLALHTLFTLEHNARWALNINWWGLLSFATRRWGRLGRGHFLFGIPGSRTEHHTAPYSLTEEFVAVYRMHSLLPDEFSFFAAGDRRHLGDFRLVELLAADAPGLLKDKLPPDDVLFSLGRARCGAVTLHNFPVTLQQLEKPGPSGEMQLLDLAAIDILRDRERGVPRYNEFRRRFHLKAARSFEELTDDPQWQAELREVYGDDIERVDLQVGMLVERRPEGFAFSDTAFRVFILMASRRLQSDRFFTDSWGKETYTQIGMKWIRENGLKDVLLRHYPSLSPALRDIKNPFELWSG